MNKERKRINLSVSPQTFDKLKKYATTQRFKNECELVVSMINVMLDRLEAADRRRYDIPEDDGLYIDSMFVEMANTTRQPDGEKNETLYHRNKNDETNK